MGKFRDGLMRRFRHGPEYSPARYHFRPPATEPQLTQAESALGLTIPAPLREMYREFDGVGHDGHGAGDALWDGEAWDRYNPWAVMPSGLLAPWKQFLTRTYYAEIEGWLEEFSKCVMFDAPECGAQFYFMTDQQAWGVPPGLVGVWNHDGGDGTSLGESLEEFLVR